jgi:lysophospholipase L1-like esterase
MKSLLIVLLMAISISSAQRLVCGIGDSITAGATSSPPANPVTIMATNLNTFTGLTWTTVNQGSPGSSSADWISGSSLLNGAITACAGATYVVYMIGTNDCNTNTETSQANWQTNVQSTITALKGAGFNKIMLSWAPYVNANSAGWSVSVSNPFLVLYQGAITNLVAGDPTHVFLGDTQAYAFFQANPSDQTDGIHPNNTWYAVFGGFWATAFEKDFLATGTSRGGSVSVGGPVTNN